jgi:hypothetical protein
MIFLDNINTQATETNENENKLSRGNMTSWYQDKRDHRTRLQHDESSWRQYRWISIVDLRSAARWDDDDACLWNKTMLTKLATFILFLIKQTRYFSVYCIEFSSIEMSCLWIFQNHQRTTPILWFHKRIFVQYLFVRERTLN